ncbi:Gm11232 [Phodopus roborovskii]|uniref:Gm11232 protein n=1 Tax=Phodopus roborovskii TaxID=109678 RepID=A0AAU9ZCN6_PHORO|nr:Gm11232 [Phodopus roborovskii]
MGETDVKSGSVCSDAVSPSPSKTKQPVDQKEEESREMPSRNSEASPVRQADSLQSPEVEEPRQKGPRQSSAGSSRTRHHHSSRGHLEEKKSRASPYPARDRGRHQPESTPAKQHRPRDSRHTEPRVKNRRPLPRPPVRALKRRRYGDTCAAPSRSAKRLRQHSPEDRCFREPSPLSRVMDRMGSLEVALEELQAPGGAFLPEPSSSTEPGVSQRAWLSWQLSHAGVALHWALHRVKAILADQAWLPR